MSLEVSTRYGIRKAIQALLVLMVISNLLLAAKVLFHQERNRQTLVPPQIHKPFWVEDGALDPNYIDQMATYLLQLRWNRTPQTCEGNKQLLLRYVGAGSYGEVQRELAADCAKLRNLNASQVFRPAGIEFPKGDSRAVIVTGSLATFIADKRTSELTKRYWVRLGLSGGTVHLDTLRETADDAALQTTKESIHDTTQPAD